MFEWLSAQPPFVVFAVFAVTIPIALFWIGMTIAVVAAGFLLARERMKP